MGFSHFHYCYIQRFEFSKDLNKLLHSVNGKCKFGFKEDICSPKIHQCTLYVAPNCLKVECRVKNSYKMDISTVLHVLHTDFSFMGVGSDLSASHMLVNYTTTKLYLLPVAKDV